MITGEDTQPSKRVCLSSLKAVDLLWVIQLQQSQITLEESYGRAIPDSGLLQTQNQIGKWFSIETLLTKNGIEEQERTERLDLDGAGTSLTNKDMRPTVVLLPHALLLVLTNSLLLIEKLGKNQRTKLSSWRSAEMQ